MLSTRNKFATHALLPGTEACMLAFCVASMYISLTKHSKKLQCHVSPKSLEQQQQQPQAAIVIAARQHQALHLPSQVEETSR